MSIKETLKSYVNSLRSAMNPYLRKASIRLEKSKFITKNVQNPTAGNDYIAEIVKAAKPAAIGKIGSMELLAVLLHLRGRNSVPTKQWDRCQKYLYVNAGVHPCSDASHEVFFHEYVKALEQLDLLGIWYNSGEAYVTSRFCKSAFLSPYRCLEPYYQESPWSAELAGKTVLVMSPFADTIKKQYTKRELIWSKFPEVLPEFNLCTIKVPLSDAITKSPYETWKDCLDDLKRQMDAVDFDVALVGAGAYSLPLCAYAKSLGKIGIHMGGSTQILFGIIGERWVKHNTISLFFNEHWCRPSADESPASRTLVECGCYW